MLDTDVKHAASSQELTAYDASPAKGAIPSASSSGCELCGAVVKCVDAVWLKRLRNCNSERQSCVAMKAGATNALKSLLALSNTAKTTALECELTAHPVVSISYYYYLYYCGSIWSSGR